MRFTARRVLYLHFDEIHHSQSSVSSQCSQSSVSQLELPLHGHVAHPLPDLQPLEVQLLQKGVSILQWIGSIYEKVIFCFRLFFQFFAKYSPLPSSCADCSPVSPPGMRKISSHKMAKNIEQIMTSPPRESHCSRSYPALCSIQVRSPPPGMTAQNPAEV